MLTTVGAFGAGRPAAARTMAPEVGTTTPGAPASEAAPAAAGSPPHIMLIVEENEGYKDIIGSSSAPYLNGLATSYVSATNWYGVQHNSPHDYLDLTIGSDLNLPNGKPYSVPMIVDELHSSGTSWKGYMESMPSNCANGSTSNGLYDPNHNPFHYFTHYSSAPGGWCNSANLGTEGVLPYPGPSGLVTALNAANAPDFVFLVPNDCDDMHGDSPNAASPCNNASNTQLIRTGDTWLSNNLPGVLSSSWFQQDGIVIITWDEGSDSSGCCGLGSPGGHVATIVVTTGNQGAGTFATTGDHYGALRAIEEAYGVGLLGGSANTVNGDLTGSFGKGKVTTGSISGSVTDSVTSAPLAGVAVSYSGGSTTTNASGAYTLTGVSPGTYTVTASASGYTPGSAPVKVTAGANATKNFALLATTGSITGKVTDAVTHLAIASATVTCTCQTGSTPTDGSGTYTFSNIAPAGTYRLTFSFTGYVPQTINNVGVIAGHATTENVALGQLPPGGIAGTVTDGTAAGSPALTGVTVTCSCQSGSVPTDGSGVYSFTSVAPGSYSLTFADTGFVTATITGVVVTSGVVTPESVALTEDGGIIGAVTDAQTSLPLAGVTVTCDSGCPIVAPTDGGGNYAFTNVPPGTYALTFSDGRYVTQTASAVIVVAGTTTVINTVALTEDGGISGTVTDEQTTQPIPGATVTCAACPVTTATTDNSGDYAFMNVPNGTAYSITVSAAGYVTQTLPGVSVSGPNDTTIAMVLTEVGGVSGAVVAAGSLTPIQNATLTCTCATGTVPTDSSGAYTFMQVTPGSAYTVSVTAAGYAGQTSLSFAVNPGSTSTVSFQLSPVSTKLGVGETFGAANATGSTSVTATTATATTSGDLLVVTVRDRSSPLTAVISINDNSSGLNTWTRATGIQNSQGDEEIWYVAGAAGVTSVTVNVTGSASLAMTVLDISGATASPLDATATGRGSKTVASTGTTGSTGQANEIAVADIGWNGAISPSKDTAGYTLVASQQSKVPSVQTGELAAWRVLGATGAQGFAATLSSSVPWLGAIATFK